MNRLKAPHLFFSTNPPILDLLSNLGYSRDLFNDLLNPQDEKRLNILFIEDCEGSQEMLSIIQEKMEEKGAGILRVIPIIYIANNRVQKTFHYKTITSPENVGLGAVVDISRIFSEWLPLSQKQKP